MNSENRDYLESFFHGVRIVMWLVFGVIFFIGMIILTTGNIGGLLFMLMSAILLFVSLACLRVEEIVLTDVTAMSENIYLITVMLEKKLGSHADEDTNEENANVITD